MKEYISLLELLPDEILEKILNKINIKELFKLKLINKRFYIIISRYININMDYCLIINFELNNINRKYYSIIRCSRCENLKNIKKICYTSYEIDCYIKCKYCKYMECDYEPYIKNLEIKISGLYYDIDLKKDEFIEKIYSLSKIKNSRLILNFEIYTENYENQERTYNHVFLENLLFLILNKTHKKVEIYSSDSIILNNNIYIKNDKLKSIIINMELLKLRLKFKKLKEIEIYNFVPFNEDFSKVSEYINNFTRYIKKYSLGLEKIIIDDDFLFYLNDYDLEIIKDKIKTLKINLFLKYKDNETKNDLIQILNNVIRNNNNLVNIEINVEDKMFVKTFIKTVHNTPHAKKY